MNAVDKGHLSPGQLDRTLAHWAAATPAAAALIGPRRSPLAYRDLLTQISRISAQLSAGGVARGDRVAVVLPNGPEMAVAVLGATSHTACAPLNPAFTIDEFRFYLGDLRPKAILLAATNAGPARIVAGELDIPCLYVTWDETGSAGTLEISAAAPAMPTAVTSATADDVALLLHTSGTTSRPKLVPLTHRNLLASACNIAASLALRPDDRCLNVMPLFHIHGFVAGLLASLVAGASVACAPGMRKGQFAAWLEELKPTWYTAVPTMHQAVLDEMAAQEARPVPSSLRFVRSSSAPLAPSLAKGLEATFGVPVIEAYGMTEAAHQIASNPLPPRTRKLGTVGLPAGPDVAIVDSEGRSLDPGETGEIVIRGENVTSGYEGNAEANRVAFVNGWFRTGDLGSLDSDGYLTISGRLKEIINRGGEKVSPREVDDALLTHPAVREAVAFAVPHPTLGEDIAAAVVLRAGANVTAADLRAWLFDRLARFKVPSLMHFVGEIPRGATGKIQRLSLAAHFAALRAAPKAAQLVAAISGETSTGGPASGDATSSVSMPQEIESCVATMFSEVLRIGPVGADDNFFALGGDSLRGGQVLSRVQAHFGVDLLPLTLFRAPTVAELAREIERALAKRPVT